MFSTLFLCHRKVQEIFTAEHISSTGQSFRKVNIQELFHLLSAAGSISPSCVNIFVDLGFGTQYSASTINGVQLTTSTFYIGSALTTPYGIIGNSYLAAAIPNNPPFTLLNRPSNNNVVK